MVWKRLIMLGEDPEWSPRFPDLTPCDFFLWGYLRDEVFKHTISNIEDLKRVIRAEFESIPQEMIERAYLSVERRLNDVIGVGGGSVQHERNL